MADADVRWLQRLENYERALATLERALDIAASRPLSELEQQGLIQTFEFTHELSWLLLKDFLVDQGVSGISGSRDAVRQAVVRELLPAGTESTWMAMIRSRNHISTAALKYEAWDNANLGDLNQSLIRRDQLKVVAISDGQVQDIGASQS